VEGFNGGDLRDRYVDYERMPSLPSGSVDSESAIVSDVIARPRDIRYRTVFLVNRVIIVRRRFGAFAKKRIRLALPALLTCIRFRDLSLAIESRGLTKIRRSDDPFTADRGLNERRAIRRSGGRVSRACGNII